MDAVRRWLSVPVLIAVLAYGTLGFAYHRVSKACWDARHADDEEGEVYGGAVGLAFDLVLWPVFLTAYGFTGVTCESDAERHFGATNL